MSVRRHSNIGQLILRGAAQQCIYMDVRTTFPSIDMRAMSFSCCMSASCPVYDSMIMRQEFRR